MTDSVKWMQEIKMINIEEVVINIEDVQMVGKDLKISVNGKSQTIPIPEQMQKEVFEAIKKASKYPNAAITLISIVGFIKNREKLLTRH